MTRKRVLWASTSMTTRGGVATCVRTLRDTPLWSDWNIRHVATHYDGSIGRKLFAFFIGGCTFVFHLVFHRPALVHLHTASYGSFARKALLAWISFLVRVPVVLQVHGGKFHEFYERSPRFVRAVIQLTLARSAAVIALGNVWEGRLRTISPQAHITVIPNAVALTDRPPGSVDAGSIDVLFLGNITDDKGAFTLIDAWARLRAMGDAGNGVRLHLVGDGEVQRARDLVAELSLNDTVSVHDWLPPGEVRLLLASSGVLALPSRDEGQPMAVLEAMAHGLCVIATPVGGVPDLIDDHCGVLVPSDDAPALSRAMREVLSNHALRERLAAKALQRIRDKFDIDVVWRRYEALYREVAR